MGRSLHAGHRFRRADGRFAFENLRIDATDVESTGQFATSSKRRIPGTSCRACPGHPGKVLRTEWQTRVLSRDRKIGGGSLSAARSALVSGDRHGYSLVLCKNVLLHFQPLERIEVIRMFHRALAPGGFFATEQTQEMPPRPPPCSSGDRRRAFVPQGGGWPMRVLTLENSGQSTFPGLPGAG